MRLSTVLLALLPACGFSSGSGSAGGDGGGTGGDSGGPADATQCFGSYVRVCFDSAADVPSAPVTWSDSVDIDSDSADASSLCNQHNSQKATFCVVAGAGIALAATATLRGHGSKPLVLLSTAPVVLDGIVDVSSTTAGVRGAGASPSSLCTGQSQAKDSSGGAGGSFAGQGGDGQRVGGTAQDTPGAGPLVPFPPALRGGCPGGNGAKTAVGAGGPGGNGGGAVAIIAPSVTINNKINASGAGGKGGPVGKSGGGGGGSGGMIVLEVPAAGTLRGINGMLFANGGGGGEGGAESPLATGADGGSPIAPGPSALGGSSSTGNDGGNGGSGSSGSDVGGGNSPGMSGGGGGGGAGGGGAGYIYAPEITGSAVISPASQPSLPAAAN